jgi:hypothetical protein
MKNDTSFECVTCNEQAEGNFAIGLSTGWPQHCEKPMRIIECDVDIMTVVHTAFAFGFPDDSTRRVMEQLENGGLFLSILPDEEDA